MSEPNWKERAERAEKACAEKDAAGGAGPDVKTAEGGKKGGKR